MTEYLKDFATICSLLIAAVALWRNIKGDTKKDGAVISEILFKLDLTYKELNEFKTEFKSEVKSMTCDLEKLKERVTVVEQSVKSAHKRIDDEQHC